MKKPNNPIILLFLAILLLGGIWAWQTGFFGLLSAKKSTEIVEEQPPVSNSEIVERQLTEETENYSVEIKYPSFVGLADGKTSKELSRYFKEKAQKELDDFIKNVTESAVSEVGAQSQLISRYEVFWQDDSFLSLKMETMSYVEGMAHPSTYDSVFNYDIGAKKQLQLDDFFNPNSGYLEPLSLKAKEEVKKQLGEYYDDFMASEGTAPKKENYENFIFDKDGLTFIFGQYKVAPYAAGIISIKIPYGDMAEFNSQSETAKKLTGK